MKNKKFWINLSLLNLFVVAFLGMILRSKILFSIPFIDYNNLLDGHGHFAFGGWVTLVLMVLMVYELLPATLYLRTIYQWLLGGLFISSWGLLLSYIFSGTGFFSNFFSTLFIGFTYVIGYYFIRDMRKTQVDKTVRLLSVIAIVCLILSSTGPLGLAYLFGIKSLKAILYRDALFTYLHLNYNGFFTLAVFALLFSKIETKITEEAKRNIHRFSVLLSVSIIPSLFLSYLWHNPNDLFRVIAISGSILLLLSFTWFIISTLSIMNIYKAAPPIVRHLGLLSMTAFMLKLILQSCTIFPPVGNAVFGDRPIIIGFLHLVFLVFVSLFILAYLGQRGELSVKDNFTRIAFLVFTFGVVSNEAFLMAQGLGVMLFISSSLFPWLLWITSIILFAGALLIGIARIKNNALKS
jgi:hypothetical protein